MLDYTLLLHGLHPHVVGLPAPLVRDVLDVLDHSAKGSMLLHLAGASTTSHVHTLQWMEEAVSFLVTGFTDEAPGMTLRVPSLVDVLPREFVHSGDALGIDPSQSAISLMNESLQDALRGDTDSDAYDEPLLSSFEGFERVFNSGVETMELRNGRWDAPIVRVTPAGIDRVRQLHRKTPSARRIRLAGRIVEVRMLGGLAFLLRLTSGEHVRCVHVKGKPELVAQHLGGIAVVSGFARFRPSGKLLRVDVERIAAGTERDTASWSVLPRPLDGHVREVRRPQGPETGLNAIIGKWPGDETDDEIFRLLEEIS